MVEKVNEEQVAYLQERSKDSLVGLLDITFDELKLDKVVMSMPVGPKTHQPYGILHGGASVVLAETAASVATGLNVDPETKIAVGLEINANHVRSKSEGVVTATATPLHKGRTTMIWEIKITDEAKKLVCVSRCTMAVLDKPI
ncbi:hotdog fold thioesterase [Shouchella shacheensis]|uniref:hotdog fold thioesterase n=1 Tax=Shouchella shacheensis TaxID=1649580 RepID=UPI00074048F8|nr:hotdog fold thioesterase [Shouchella shacheensis]